MRATGGKKSSGARNTALSQVSRRGWRHSMMPLGWGKPENARHTVLPAKYCCGNVSFYVHCEPGAAKLGIWLHWAPGHGERPRVADPDRRFCTFTAVEVPALRLFREGTCLHARRRCDARSDDAGSPSDFSSVEPRPCDATGNWIWAPYELQCCRSNRTLLFNFPTAYTAYTAS